MVAVKEIPDGFQQTEIGIIPSDWTAIKINDLSIDMLQGVNTAIDIPEYVEDGIPMLKANNIIDQAVNFETADHVSLRTYQSYSDRFKLKMNDFLFSNIGARLGTGSLLRINTVSTFAWNVMRIIPDCKIIEPEFLHYLMNSIILFKAIKLNETGSGMGFVPKNILREIYLPLPPTKAEQKAIATALNDADNLISELEKLIAKKKIIKQGAMQELLSPKEGWEVKTIESIFDVTAGGDFKNEFSSEIKSEEYRYPIYSNSLVSEGLYGYCSYYTSDANCITVTARGTIGYANYRNHKFTAIGRVIVLNPKLAVDCFYVSEYINNKIDFVLEVTGVPQLTAPQISKYTISLPSKKEEQSRISKTLQDMDSEIESLKKKLDKYKMIKQGMMQNLLTGKIRLV